MPKKLAGLTVITNELANDSDPAALQVVGDGLVRDLQTKIDAAFFANTTSNGPSGLGSLTSVQHVASGSIADLDWAAEAISLAETVGVQLSAFVANPATVLDIQTLKVATSYNQPLLGVDAARPPSAARSACRCSLHRLSPPAPSGASRNRGCSS